MPAFSWSLIPLLALGCFSEEPPEVPTPKPPAVEEPDPLLPTFEGVNLPVIPGGTTPELAVSVVVTRDRIVVDGVPTVGLEIPEAGLAPVVSDQELKGQLITKLYDILLEKAEGAKTLGEYSPEFEFEGDLLLAVDESITFSTVRQVMYTAGQAQFVRFMMVVEDPDSGRPKMLESTLPTIGRCSDFRLIGTGVPGSSARDLFGDSEEGKSLLFEMIGTRGSEGREPSTQPPSKAKVPASKHSPRPEPPDCPEPPPLQLVVGVTADGLELSGASELLGCAAAEEACTLPCEVSGCPDSQAYDLAGLQALLAKAKAAHPTQERVIIVPKLQMDIGSVLAVQSAAERRAGDEVEFSDVVYAGGVD